MDHVGRRKGGQVDVLTFKVAVSLRRGKKNLVCRISKGHNEGGIWSVCFLFATEKDEEGILETSRPDSSVTNKTSSINHAVFFNSI